jgi:hypothetical protein
MHLNAIDRFTRWQCCLRIIVGLPRRYDMDFIPGAGQVKRQVGENLTRGGVIGKEIPVDEDQPLHNAWVLGFCSLIESDGRAHGAVAQQRFEIFYGLHKSVR